MNKILKTFEGKCKDCYFSKLSDDKKYYVCSIGGLHDLDDSCNMIVDVTSDIYKFEDELNRIKNSKIKMLTIRILGFTPKYFWALPGSSSGKGHPKDEVFTGGKVLHVKRVVKVAEYLAFMEDLSSIQKDMLCSAMILHDIFCHGIEETPLKKIDKNHPKYVRQETKEVLGEMFYYNEVMDIIEEHMGRWAKGYSYNKVVNLGKLGHIADYISSRRDIIINVKNKGKREY